MRVDSRLSVALHVLLHMGETGEVITSEALGPMLKMNPVVLRRTLGSLREAGILSAVKGHGGGWSLARELDDVTLADVYRALGPTHLFGIGHRDVRAGCPVEQAVNRTVGGALDEAEEVFMERLGAASVADILVDARRKLATCKRSRKGDVHA